MQTTSNIMNRSADKAERATQNAFGAAINTGMAWLDMMVNFQREMQRASWQSLSSYSPTADARITGTLPHTPAATQVIPVGEERLNVATRTIQGETTRIRRRVVSQPVEQQVTLRQETVVVERRPPASADPRPDVLTETVIEMSDSRQVPTVWKSLHVAEEVVLRKQVTERVEHVRDTVRRDVVDVEQAGDRPAAATLTHDAIGQAAAAAPQMAAAATEAAVKQAQHEAEQRAAELRASEQRASEQRASEQRAAEQRASEQRAAEQRAGEQRAGEQKAQDEADKAADRKPGVSPAGAPAAARKA